MMDFATKTRRAMILSRTFGRTIIGRRRCRSSLQSPTYITCSPGRETNTIFELHQTKRFNDQGLMRTIRSIIVWPTACRQQSRKFQTIPQPVNGIYRCTGARSMTVRRFCGYAGAGENQQNLGDQAREKVAKVAGNNDKMVRLVHTWWSHNRDVVLHAIQNGRFHDNDDDDDSNDVEMMPSSSLVRFQQVYATNAAYHDLFIIAQGQKAVRYSFELIALFWDLELTNVGELEIIANNKDNDGDAYSTQNQRQTSEADCETVAIVRLPFRVNQKLKLLPFLVASEYSGWVYLHLVQSKKHQQQDESDPSFAFEIRCHDDRMALSESNDEDILLSIMKIPILGTSLNWFRRRHGEVVQLLSRFN